MSRCDGPDRTGELVHGAVQASVPGLLMPVEKAVREALAAYLRRQTFVVHGGKPEVGELSRCREFQLTEVLSDFPGPDQQLTYPSASVAEGAVAQHTGSFTAHALEDTWDPVSETVLWQLGRSEGTLQVDFWTDSVPVREAIDAQLPALFSPHEVGGVVLRLPPAYASATARYTLLTHQSIDPPEAVWAGERRLQVTVAFEAPLLARRRAVVLRPRIDTTVT